MNGTVAERSRSAGASAGQFPQRSEERGASPRAKPHTRPSEVLRELGEREHEGCSVVVNN